MEFNSNIPMGMPMESTTAWGPPQSRRDRSTTVGLGDGSGCRWRQIGSIDLKGLKKGLVSFKIKDTSSSGIAAAIHCLVLLVLLAKELLSFSSLLPNRDDDSNFF